MKVTSSLHFAIDLPLRFRNAARRKLNNLDLFSKSANLSDSQVTFYESMVDKITLEEKLFRKFRRVYDYREILEHVNYDLGLRYIKRIQELEPNLLNQIAKFKTNDECGKPRTYNFREIGSISPTTLRYISVAAELRSIFDRTHFGNVVEIGGGYGGQLAILQKLDFFESYGIFDLPNVQLLISKYLDSQSITGVDFPRETSKLAKPIDLVISNYAFSELPYAIQTDYLNNVLSNSRNGYLIMNSGRSDETGRSAGKVGIEEIRTKISRIRVLEEIPLTGPDNYVIVWTDQELR